MALELQILGKLCDLPEAGIGAKFKYSAENIEEFGTPSGNFSLTIELPNTATNRAIFGNIEELGTYHLDMPAGTFDPNTAPPARLLQDGNPVFVGNARLLSWTSSAYSIQLFSGNASWFQQMRKNKLGEVDRDGTWKERRWIYNGYDIGLYVQQLAHTGFVDTTLENDVLTQNILTGGDEGTFDATIVPWAGSNLSASQNLTDYQAGGASLQLSGTPAAVTISAQDQVYTLNPNSRYRIVYYHKNRSSLTGTVNITLASLPDASVEVNDGGIDLSVINTGWQFHTFEFETGNDVAFLLKFESTAAVSGTVDLGIDQVQLIEILSERAIHDGFQVMSLPLVAYNDNEIVEVAKPRARIGITGTASSNGAIQVEFLFAKTYIVATAQVTTSDTIITICDKLQAAVNAEYSALRIADDVIQFVIDEGVQADGTPLIFNDIGGTGVTATATSFVTTDSPLEFEKLRPATMIWPLLFAHFQQSGYKLKSNWMASMATGQNPIEPLALLFNLDEFIGFQVVQEVHFYRYKTIQTDYTGAAPFLRLPIDYDSLALDTFGESVAFTINDTTNNQLRFKAGTYNVWQPASVGLYRAEISYNGQNILGVWRTEGSAAFINTDGTVERDSGVLRSNNDLVNDIGIWDFPVYAADLIATRALVPYFYNELPSDFRAEPVDNYLRIARITSEDFDMRDYLADITVGELLDSIIQMFNLKMTTDEATRTVFIEPEADFYTDTDRDLTQQVDISADIKQELLSSKHAKRFQFEYNNDTDDLNIQEFRQIQADGFPYASEQAESVNETVGGTETIQSSFSASVSHFNSFAGIWFLALENENYPEYKTDWSLRIVSIRARKSLFEHTVSYNEPVSVAGVIYDSGELETYDYIEAYFHQRLHSLKYSNDANTVGLFDRFWQNWVRTINQARILEGEMVLHKQDINELNQFNKYYSFNPTGAGAPQKVLLTELENYDPEGIQRVNFKARTVPAWQQEKQSAFNAENMLFMRIDPDPPYTANSVDFRYQNDDFFFDDSDFTIGMWINAEVPTVPQVLLAKLGVQLAIDAAGGAVVIRPILTGISGNGSGISFLNHTLPYTGPTGWIHIAWVRRGNDANDWQLFVNGQEVAFLVGTNTFNGTPSSTNTVFPGDTMFLGRRTSGGNLHYEGEMQHVFIMKRAMQAYEAEQIYNAGAGDFPYNGADLMLYCPLNQESGGITNDLASEQVGTLNGYTADELRIDSTNPNRAWQKR